MSAGVTAAGLLLAASASITIAPPVPVILMTTSPRGVRPIVAHDEAFAMAERALPPGSPLRLLTPERAGLDTARMLECPIERRLGCWAREVDRVVEAPPMLLVLASVPGADGGSMTAVAFDVEDARRIASTGARDERVEDAIFERAVTFSVPATQRDRLAREIERALEHLAAARPDLGPRGAIAIASDAPRLVVRLDGAAVGRTIHGATTLVDVPVGEHHLELLDDDVVLDRTLLVRAGATATVAWRAPPGRHELHAPSAWVGGGVAALGVATLVFAVVAPHGGVPVGADVSGFRRSCAYFGDRDASCTGGVKVAPLGFGLLTAGVVGAATYGAVAKSAEYEWWWSAVSVVAGAAVFAVSSVAD